LIASRRSHLIATWRIYRIEIKRSNKSTRQTGSSLALERSSSNTGTPRLRNGPTPFNSQSSESPLEKTS